MGGPSRFGGHLGAVLGCLDVFLADLALGESWTNLGRFLGGLGGFLWGVLGCFSISLERLAFDFRRKLRYSTNVKSRPRSYSLLNTDRAESKTNKTKSAQTDIFLFVDFYLYSG